MTSILMVCLGNICRSPLAHGIMQSKLDDSQYYVDSAGTANYHVGDSPDHRSIAVAKNHGIDISGQRGRQFKTEDFDRFDHIFVMDKSNYENVTRLARNEHDLKKVKLILDDGSGNPNIVHDPYYGDASDFQKVYEQLDAACERIAKII